MKKFKLILLFLIVAITSAGITYVFAPKNTSIQVFPFDTKGSLQLACTTKMGATLFPRANFKDHTFETIEGSLFKGDSNKMAIEIDGKTLKMITATSVGYGMTEPAKLVILRENEDELIAVDPESDIVIDKGIGTFVLNKKKGFAVWTKSKPSFFTSYIPEGQVYFMECR